MTKQLTDQQALAIYEDPRRHGEIAADYGVHYTRVSDIKYGRTYASVTGGKKKRTREYRPVPRATVRAIYKSEASARKISDKTGVNIATVIAIRAGVIRKADTGDLPKRKKKAVRFLTAEEKAAIRNDKRRPCEIVAAYGIHRSTVYAIRYRSK